MNRLLLSLWLLGALLYAGNTLLYTNVIFGWPKQKLEADAGKETIKPKAEAPRADRHPAEIAESQSPAVEPQPAPAQPQGEHAPGLDIAARLRTAPRLHRSHPCLKIGARQKAQPNNKSNPRRPRSRVAIARRRRPPRIPQHQRHKVAMNWLRKRHRHPRRSKPNPRLSPSRPRQQPRSSRPSCSRKASTSGSGRLAPLCGRDRLPPHHSSGLSDPAWR